MSGLLRTRYFLGKLLSVEDFQTEQTYHREKHYLHNRLVHGSGVVRGLSVGLKPGPTSATISVSAGVGIDPMGRELELCAPVSIIAVPALGSFLVVLKFTETLVQPVVVSGTGDSDTEEFSRIQEGCEVLLVPQNTKPPVAPGTDVLVLARFRRIGKRWVRDPKVRPKRVR